MHLAARSSYHGSRARRVRVRWALRCSVQPLSKRGVAGVAAAKAHKPDLILMDIQLPEMDGYQATRAIKADESVKHIPIIAVTSYALSGDEQKALAAGWIGPRSKPS